MRVRRWAGAGVLLAALWTLPQAQAAGDPYDPAQPGSPDVFGDADTGAQCVSKPLSPIPPDFVPPAGLPEKTPCGRTRLNTGVDAPPAATNFSGVSVLGVQGAPRLGQWIRIPPSISVAVVPIHTNLNAPDLTGEPPGTRNVFQFFPRVWFVSADRKRVGEMPPFTVSSLAFGAIPVRVTVHITQPKAADGSVVPLKVSQANPATFTGVGTGTGGQPNTNLVRDAHGTGAVDVRLSDATVDGVPLDLGSRCHTSRLANLTVTGDGYLYNGADSRLPVPDGKYNAARGGTLHGTLDIPAFTGCVSASGDDVSRLLTNLVSGPSNPITIRQSVASNQCYPLFNDATCQATLADLPLPTTLPQPVPAP